MRRVANDDERQSLRAPRPEPERISALIQRINEGDIKLPTFQRPRVWNLDQAIDLLDSVNQGYPVGSLLFWLTSHKLRSERNIGGFALPEIPEKYPRNYVLDGQQRLTTIYAVLTHPPDQLEEKWRVAYDLERNEFVGIKETASPSQVPLNVLYNTPRYMEFLESLRGREDSDELISETQRLWETFHEYVIPVVTVPEAPIDRVGIIFERINSRGTHLTVFDLMVAATWGAEESEEFNLRESVETVLEQLDDKDYSGIDDVTVLRSLSVVATGSARRDAVLGLRELSREQLQLHIEKTRSALAGAVDFLASQCSAVSSDFLPYDRQLMLLTYVMAKRSPLSANAVDVLRRWFWRTSFAERYRAGGEAFFDEDLKKAITALDSSDELKRYGEAPDKDFFIRSQFRKSAAASQAFAALLGAQNPMNIINKALIDVGTALSAYNHKEFHHLFPQKVLKDRGVNNDLINALANICMLAASENKKIGSRLPSEYVSELKEEHGDEFDSVMASNLIPPDAVECMLTNDYAGFLNARSTFLSELVRSLV